MPIFSDIVFQFEPNCHFLSLLFDMGKSYFIPNLPISFYGSSSVLHVNNVYCVIDCIKRVVTENQACRWLIFLPFCLLDIYV